MVKRAALWLVIAATLSACVQARPASAPSTATEPLAAAAEGQPAAGHQAEADPALAGLQASMGALALAVPQPAAEDSAPAGDHTTATPPMAAERQKGMGALPPAEAPIVDLTRHVQFILDSQLPSGAIALTPAQVSINPYFANLAARSLLHDAAHLLAVERYLNWYLDNLRSDGTITDYLLLHGAEVSTGSADSTDSYAATFLSLVVAWVEAGGQSDWLWHNRSKLALVAGAIEAVTDRDGLTWAKPGYPLKLLMDNAEVYQGWRDWSRLLKAQGEPGAAATAAKRADRILLALPRFKRPDSTWGWAINPLGFIHWSRAGRFYPEGVAQLFPLAFGLTEDPHGYHTFERLHPEWHTLTVGDFPWLFPAYTAALAGDTQAAEQSLAEVERQYPSLGWPWFIAESAWVIETALLLR